MLTEWLQNVSFLERTIICLSHMADFYIFSSLSVLNEGNQRTFLQVQSTFFYTSAFPHACRFIGYILREEFLSLLL